MPNRTRTGKLLAGIVLSVCLSLVFGCGTKDGKSANAPADATEVAVQDVGTDSGAAEVTPDLVGDSGPDTVDVVKTPSVRALLVESEDDLIPGFYAMGKKGDFLIENEHLSAVIGAAGHAKWGPFGGGILDLAPAGEEDVFQELFPVTGLIRAVRPESVEVYAAGGSGEAIVRVVGTDGPIPIVDAVFQTPRSGVEVTVDYVLTPESRCLEIRTTLTNPGDKDLSLAVGDAIVFAEAGRLFGAKAGFDETKLLNEASLSYLGAETAGTSFLIAPTPPAKASFGLAEDELTAALYGFIDLSPGETRTVGRCIYAAVGRSVAALTLMWEDQGVTLNQVSGLVKVATEGYDFSTVSLELARDGVFTGAAGVGPDRTFTFSAPAGAYTGTMTGHALPSMELNWESAAGSAVAGLEADPEDPGRIDATVTGPEGETIPARVSLQAGPDAPAGASLLRVVPDLEGRASMFVPAGTYTMTGSRGPGWSICRQDVAVESGGTASVKCEIEEEVHAHGWVAADLHTHSELGIDSTMHRHLRVKAHVAEGISFFAATDHDIFADYAPIIEELGASDLLMSSLGNEVSLLYGHFNCLGCTAEKFSYFEAPWVNFDEDGEVLGMMTAPEIWKVMREQHGARVIQINHPREGSSFFNHIDYDPEVGPASVSEEEFNLEFDAIEVWNSNDSWHHLVTKTLPDWYSFLNRGINKIATGNSDSHDLNGWGGQARNLTRVADVLSEDSFYDSLLSFRSQVTGAPFIEFSIDEGSLGDTVVPSVPGGEIKVDIKVWVPSWAGLTRVRLVANGSTLEEWDVPDTTTPLRFQVTQSYTLDEDTWFHVAAYEENSNLAPVYPGRQCAGFTNPIWVDLAGDGFTPPIAY